MNFKKYLIKFSLILILFSTFVEKSFSLEPEKFVQSVVDEASLVLTKNFSKEQKIEKLENDKPESKIEFNQVLAYSDDKTIEVGSPLVQGAKVEAE